MPDAYPHAEPPRQPPPAPADPLDDFIEASYAELQQKSAQQDDEWNLSASEYAVDLEDGTITFSHYGRIAVAPVQVIGTYNTQDGSFMWGWDHPSVPQPLQQAAWLVKSWGERFRKDILLTQVVNVPEMMPWYFTGLAVKLASMHGAYRAVYGPTYVFMAIGELQAQSFTDAHNQ